MTFRLWLNRITAWLLVAAFILAVLYFAGTYIKAAETQRFTRQSFSRLDDTTSISVVKDTVQGTCRAYVQAHSATNILNNSRAVADALSSTWELPCGSLQGVVILPVVSAIK